MTSRRSVLTGCAALVASPALAGVRRARPAPRLSCPHPGCRHHRRDGDGPGRCGLALRARAAYPDEVLP